MSQHFHLCHIPARPHKMEIVWRAAERRVFFSEREREKEVPSTPEEASLKIAAELVSIAIFDSCSVTGTPPPHSLSGLFLGGREPPQVKISNISTVYPPL